MADTAFENHRPGLESPGTRHYDAGALASDTVDLTPLPRALYFSVAGVARLRDAAGVDLSYAVTAGTILPFRFTRLWSTGTDAALKSAGATIAWY